MRISGLLAAVVACGALTVAGCGRDLDNAEVATNDSGAQLTADQRAAVRTSNTLTRKGRPASVVRNFVRDVRDGAGPAFLHLYDSRIPARVGEANVLGALQAVSEITRGTRPAVVRSTRTRAGQLVILRLLRGEGDDSTYSFVLRRQDKRWIIAYDSLLAQGLQSYVQASRSTDPGKPSRAATKAAARAVSELRLAARARPPAAPSTASGGPSPAPTGPGATSAP